MKKAILMSASVCAFLLVVACGSKDLSRNEAKKILQKYPHQITIKIVAGPYSDPNPTEENALLVKNGYGSVKRTGPMNFLTFIPNDKLKPYIVKTEQSIFLYLLVSKCEPDEITGISKQSDTTCTVEFTSKLDDNVSKYPIRNVLMNYVDKSELSNCSIKRNVSFRRYDDGWRVEDESAVY